MSATTAPRLICRLTLSTAASPPNRFVRFVSSRMLSAVSGTGSLLDRGRFFLHRRVLELLLADTAREQALRAQQPDQNEGQAEDQELHPPHLRVQPRPVARLHV